MESGSCDSGDFFRPYGEATAFSKTFARSVGCDYQKEGPHILDCLRKLPTGKPTLYLFHDGSVPIVMLGC
jgi:hypothetical protein